VVLNTDKNEVADTYFYGTLGSAKNTNAVTFDNVNIYAATDDGVYFANKTSVNLADYNQWGKLTTLPTAKFSNIVNYLGTLVVCKDSPNWESDSVFYNNGTIWQKILSYGLNINKLEVFNNKLIVAANGVAILDNNFDVVDNIYSHNNAFWIDAAGVYLDASNNYWIADKNKGLLRQKNNWDVEKILPNGPNTPSSFAIDVNDGNVWMTSGGYGNHRNNNPYNYRVKGDWKTAPTYVNNPQNGGQLHSFVSVAINPKNVNQVFVGSWGKGLLEFVNGNLNYVYTAQNSELDSSSGGITAISGMAFDKNNNLWAASSYSNNVLSVKTPSNNWYNYNLFGSNNGIAEYKTLIVDKNNYVWIQDQKNLKTYVFDYNSTLDVKTDDRVFSSLKFETAEIVTFIEDLDGEIWFGTSQGVGVMYNSSNVFSGNESIQSVYLQQDGQTQLLLETETVTAIAIDGANRKWFGTENSGVFLMSEDGSEEILHFTTKNSPLFADNIYDIKINGKTGEVYIATEKGLISYKGTATDAQDDFSNVFVYPNPVREDYHGVIAIRGLVEDTDVRITDISGNLVSQTKSLGGQAIWDGKDLKGNRVQTGVYMVFNASQDGGLKKAAKILFIH
jgi:ligand-binding sensor domain-containing protein